MGKYERQAKSSLGISMVDQVPDFSTTDPRINNTHLYVGLNDPVSNTGIKYDNARVHSISSVKKQDNL